MPRLAVDDDRQAVHAVADRAPRAGAIERPRGVDERFFGRRHVLRQQQRHVALIVDQHAQLDRLRPRLALDAADERRGARRRREGGVEHDQLRRPRQDRVGGVQRLGIGEHRNRGVGSQSLTEHGGVLGSHDEDGGRSIHIRVATCDAITRRPSL